MNLFQLLSVGCGELVIGVRGAEIISLFGSNQERSETEEWEKKNSLHMNKDTPIGYLLDGNCHEMLPVNLVLNHR